MDVGTAVAVGSFVVACIALVTSIALPLYLDSRADPRVIIRGDLSVQIEPDHKPKWTYGVLVHNRGRLSVKVVDLHLRTHWTNQPGFSLRSLEGISVARKRGGTKREFTLPQELGPHDGFSLFVDATDLGWDTGQLPEMWRPEAELSNGLSAAASWNPGTFSSFDFRAVRRLRWSQRLPWRRSD